MKKFKSLSLATAVLLLLAGCTASQSPSQNSPLADAAPATAQSVINTQGKKLNSQGWELTITGVRSEGQTLQGQYTTYEAAEAWTVVSVSLKNTSGKRQREEDAPFSLLFSELVDSTGKEYEAKETEIKYNYDLINKPFSPGESRAEDYLFDIPKNVKLKELVVFNPSLEDSIRIKL